MTCVVVCVMVGVSCFVYSWCVVYMCFYSVFFFFKQKTAYEMRISDWSSDVCSSDLAGSGGGRRNAWTCQGQRLVRSLAGAGFEVALYEEIGRASCRERVCQYV